MDMGTGKEYNTWRDTDRNSYSEMIKDRKNGMKANRNLKTEAASSRLGGRADFITFIAIEAIVYMAFLYGDISGSMKIDIITRFKFFAITLCISYALNIMVKQKKRDNYILGGAMVFTGISDYFLLFTDKFTLGMATFCVVQVLYLFRLWNMEREEGGSGRKGLWVRITLNLFLWLAVYMVLRGFHMDKDPLLPVAAFYFITILHNVIVAVKNAVSVPSWKRIVFASGMFLFLLCDINVGIYNMSGFLAVDNGFYQKMYSFAEIAMWMFYLPAQVCIAISGLSAEKARWLEKV